MVKVSVEQKGKKRGRRKRKGKRKGDKGLGWRGKRVISQFKNYEK